ncbi:MAG: CsiV family protein [Pseudomonadota bacterium]|nr:CsiV family protein [Pseudomonadota bacterium]
MSHALKLLRLPVIAMALLAVVLMASPSASFAQSGERWYQVEVTLFLHETGNFDEENWPQEEAYFTVPENALALSSMLDVLTLADWEQLADAPLALANSEGAEVPVQQRAADEAFRLPDLSRDAFLQLPAEQHDFRQTNQALERASGYRVLYHAAWRQPMTQASRATPIIINGGRQFGDTAHELQGSLRLFFNRNETRVVLESALWFNQFAGENITRRIPVQSSRDMRSNEFHYLDHPAVGILVQVFPYEVPPAVSLANPQF